MESAASQGERRVQRLVNRLEPLLTLAREQPGLTALALMSLAGLGISIYLTIVHYTSRVALVCTTGGAVNCQKVTTSAYSVVPLTSIPVTIPGMIWFLALGVAAVIGLRAWARGADEPQWMRGALLLWTIAGLLFVVYLVYAEIVKVQNICEWCTAVHLLTLASFLIALTRWQRRFEPAAPRIQAPAVTPAAPRAATPARPTTPAVPHRTRRALSQRSGRTR
jgi:uncharacterized membrane protein